VGLAGNVALVPPNAGGREGPRPRMFYVP
jgi:hypothetical protein